MNPRIARSKLSHERWLVSYADFITLLFAFFVVMYAFASADRKKQMQVSAAIDSAFESLSVAPVTPGRRSKTAGVLSPAVRPPAVIMTDPVSAKRVQADLELLRKDLANRLSSEIAQRRVSIDLGRDGLVISLREAGFFDSGTAVPRPETAVTLRQIGESLAGTPYEVRVEGHTDTIPIHNAEFDSNWELSSARATRIARMLLDMRTITPERISAAGYAEYHPAASNDTPEGRAENRRVDLVVMPRTVLPVSPEEAAKEKAGWRKISDQ
jgi:chemotaxis protein MotB